MIFFTSYIQHNVMDCGLTCLRMVAAFYGKRYSLDGLREKSFITREGVSMLGISEAAEKLGFRSMCVQVGYKMLMEAPLPCIVHWNQQHFVVVYRMNDKHVWVADPAAGKLKYTREEFCQCWLSTKKEGEDAGVALLVDDESTYTVTVSLPQDLHTSYNRILDFKGELSGTAEVMTDERSITGRLFDPLRYLWESICKSR